MTSVVYLKRGLRGKHPMPCLVPLRKVTARLDVNKVTVILQLWYIRSRRERGGWMQYMSPKIANSRLESKTRVWSWKFISENGQKEPECGSRSWSYSWRPRMQKRKGLQSQARGWEGTGRCRSGSHRMRARPASFPSEGYLELTWTENSPSEQIRNLNIPLGWNQRPKLRIQNLTETYLRFHSYSQTYFCKYRQSTQKAKAWLENKSKQASGLELTKTFSMNSKSDQTLHAQRPKTNITSDTREGGHPWDRAPGQCFPNIIPSWHSKKMIARTTHDQRRLSRLSTSPHTWKPGAKASKPRDETRPTR